MEEILSRGVTFMYLLCPAVLVLTSIKTAPYGRYVSSGRKLPARIAWFAFESPNLIIPACLALITANAPIPSVNKALLAFFLIHYINRTVIYPLRMPQTATPMPILIFLSSVCFCCFNASIQSLALLLHRYSDTWFYDLRFVIGITTGLTGMAINIHSDSILLGLRKTDRYQIPNGGLFRFVSCPNFLGEILEWSGWAISCWSYAAASFALFTICNLAPRAWSHHAYYRRKFEHYPDDRKALVPFVL